MEASNKILLCIEIISHIQRNTTQCDTMWLGSNMSSRVVIFTCVYYPVPICVKHRHSMSLSSAKYLRVWILVSLIRLLLVMTKCNYFMGNWLRNFCESMLCTWLRYFSYHEKERDIIPIKWINKVNTVRQHTQHVFKDLQANLTVHQCSKSMNVWTRTHTEQGTWYPLTFTI